MRYWEFLNDLAKVEGYGIEASKISILPTNLKGKQELYDKELRLAFSDALPLFKFLKTRSSRSWSQIYQHEHENISLENPVSRSRYSATDSSTLFL